MNPKQRLRCALNHQPPDRVPVDFGAGYQTGIHVSVVAQLRDYFGLEDRPVKVTEPYQMLGEVDRELRDILGVDVVAVPGAGTMFGFAPEGWKEYRLPWGQVALVPGGFETTIDDAGDTLIYPGGDTTAPPSGRMPANGYFFDAIIRQQPIDEDRLVLEDNLEEFGPVDGATLAHFRTHAEHAARTGKGVYATMPGTALGDIALVPATFLKRPRGVRDVEAWYMLLATNPGFVADIFDHQTDLAIENLRVIHGAVGDAIDVLFLCGTDFGTQTGTFCSVQTFDELYLPRYRRMNDWVHGHTTWKTFKHSCGSVVSLIPSFIEAGFDVLNPVQWTAAGMDRRELKRRFGSDIVFWGGGVDTQHTLPFGSPESVEREVIACCEHFAPGGGFVFNTVHNTQALTPIENFIAMVNAVNRFNGVRPLSA